MSAERPILVSSALIGPILRGEKRVTRRLPRNPGGWHLHPAGPTTLSCYHTAPPHFYAERDIDAPCAVGDVLWVRETWAHTTLYGNPITVYNAEDNRTDYGGPWKPSNHMKRADARIFLRVEDVRVERVQDITEEDAQREGLPSNSGPLSALAGMFADRTIREFSLGALADGLISLDTDGKANHATYRGAFACLWDSLAPAGSKWADNPWVWVIRFKLEAR